jgi:histidine triad (HIT) family protein
MPTIFERIIGGELPADKVYEDDDILAIKDLYPKAPVHLLIITKKVIPDLQSLQPEDYPLLGKLVAVAQKLASEFGIEKGYRLITNNGAAAGQSIHHLHFHLVGGGSWGFVG